MLFGALPRLQYRTEICVTRQAVPTFPHPPLSTKVAKTSLALFLGHITHNGTSVTTKQRIWPNKLIVSIMGRLPAPQVLKNMVITRKAMLMRVYCQLGKTNSASDISISVWIKVLQTKTELATLASQPKVLIQPAE